MKLRSGNIFSKFILLRKKDPWLLTLVSLVFDIGEIIHSNDLFNNTDSFRNKSLALHVSRDMFLDSALTLFQIWIKMFFFLEFQNGLLWKIASPLTQKSNGAYLLNKLHDIHCTNDVG